PPRKSFERNRKSFERLYANWSKTLETRQVVRTASKLVRTKIISRPKFQEVELGHSNDFGNIPIFLRSS
ncbi:hypothetical protein GIB67_014114, partial [Kingdonia uniflora]